MLYRSRMTALRPGLLRTLLVLVALAAAGDSARAGAEPAFYLRDWADACPAPGWLGYGSSRERIDHQCMPGFPHTRVMPMDVMGRLVMVCMPVRSPDGSLYPETIFCGYANRS